MAEAACSCGKSGLFICQKKPIHVAKEAYSRGKRDLLILAYLRYPEVSKETYNRPKETYLYAKRDLQITGIPEGW